VQQLEKLDKEVDGGLEEYIRRAKKLLQEAKNGENPFKDRTAQPAKGMANLRYGTTTEQQDKMLKELERIENMGQDELEGCAFVLVAGGSGEGLGFGTKEYPRVKISIIAEVTTGVTFMEMYAQYILAFEKKIEKKKGTKTKLPLVIMTSDETDELTRDFLQRNKFFGLEKTQVSYVKQDSVPALEDVNATLHLDSKQQIVLKPHGHGDVHALLVKHKILQRWKDEKRKWLVIFQDTNPLHFRCLTALLGVSKEKKLVMNSAAVPRKAGEKVGAIAQLDGGGKSMTISVEYNQLESLLALSGGDKPVDGYSEYPGNINFLVFDIGRMADILQAADFRREDWECVNPKWVEEKNKMKFKTPTRLECMMQDFPKLASDTDNIGYTMFDREMCFSCVKNELKEAKIAAGPDCAFSCEADIYKSNAMMMMMAARMKGKEVIIEPDLDSERLKETFAGITCKLGPRIVLRPSFGISVSDVAQKIHGNIVIKNERKKCALVLEDNVEFHSDGGDAISMVLDGAIRIKAEDRKKDDPVIIKGLDCFNEGQKVVALSKEDIQRDFKDDIESYQIRLYGPTLKLQNMFTLTQSWEGVGKTQGELNGGGTFTIKEKTKDR